MLKKINENLYPPVLLNELKRSITTINYRIKKDLPKFIFLCGKNKDIGKNRGKIEELYRAARKDVIVFYSEDIYDSNQTDVDLLTFEDFLTYLSDGIIIVLESYGTAAELGAFALSKQLVDNMIVLVDTEYETHKSFLSQGPLKKIKSVIYTGVASNAIFSNPKVYNELVNFLDSKKCIINRNEEQVCIKSFVIEVLDIISVVGPITQDEIILIYKYIKGFSHVKFRSMSDGKRDDESYVNKSINLNIKDLFKMLLSCKLLTLDKNNYIYVNPQIVKKNNLLFDSQGGGLDSLRSKFLARKYKYCIKSVNKI